MYDIRVRVYGLREVQNMFKDIAVKTPKRLKKAELRVAKSVMGKARVIIDKETTAHTGTLRQDVRIKPTGKHYKVVVGEYAPYAHIIEHGRKAIMGYKFVPTQYMPLEGYAVRAPGRMIKAAKGIHFMRRGKEHGRKKAKQITEEEMRKVTKR